MIRPRRIRREDFIFLPNMVTMFNLFTGFLSIVMAARGKMELAAWLIVLSLVWDSLDGNIARMFKNPSPLGRELDSLADLTSFVVAPAFLISRFLLRHISPWMLLFLFLYLAAGAYRLARFNLKPAVKDSFEGLPTPAAATALVMTILACIKNEWTDLTFFGVISATLLILLSFLMVSHVRYPKLSAMKFSRWQSLFYAALVVLAGFARWFNIETAFAAVLFLFLFLSPMYSSLPSVYPVPEMKIK